jgi:hypothetical protein
MRPTRADGGLNNKNSQGGNGRRSIGKARAQGGAGGKAWAAASLLPVAGKANGAWAAAHPWSAWYVRR